MSINNTTGSFNTGRDNTLVVIGPDGLTRVDIPNITDFECKPIYADINVDLMSGTQLFAALPKGWTGSIGAERGSNALDLLVASIEANWYNNGSYSGGLIYQTITEADGSQTSFMFDNVAFMVTDLGSWKGDASVKQKLEFKANQRTAL